MPTPVRSHRINAIDVRSFEVRICQVNEEAHTYYQASAEVRGRAVNAYGTTPETALANLYGEVLPKSMGLEHSERREIAFAPALHSRRYRGSQEARR